MNEADRAQRFKLYDDVVSSLHPPAAPIAMSRISEQLLLELTSAIADGRIPEERLLQVEDRKSDHLFLLVDSHDDNEKKLSENLSVLGLHRFDSSNPILSKIHQEIRNIFPREVGSPFVVVNSRMWITAPNSERFGPNNFHTDGFLPGHLKCMIYLTPLDTEHGPFEVQTPSGVVSICGFPAGTAILFQNSDVTHSGVPGTKFPRISIEITLMRSTVDHDQAWAGNFYGRHLCEPTIFHHAEATRVADHARMGGDSISKVSGGLRVNIGSGQRDWKDWLCLDELDHAGVTKIHFDSSVEFPVADESVSLFYSSHAFEHLDDSTLEKILSEMSRVGKSRSLFVLKIPDYDCFLEQYRSGSLTFMNDKGIESVLWTWKDRVDDGVLSRLSMMFCGYWNKAYGDHFLGSINTNPDAYHGPAIVPGDRLEEIFQSSSPNYIVKELCEYARSDPDFFRFNHQNAWNRLEMAQFLEKNGFRVITTNTPLIVQRFKGDIPDIDALQTWSAYYLAEKVS